MLGLESVCAQKGGSLHLLPEPAVRECAYTPPGDRDNGIAWQGDVRPISDAVVAREIAARLCADDDVVRAQCVAGIWEVNGSTVTPRSLRA